MPAYRQAGTPQAAGLSNGVKRKNDKNIKLDFTATLIHGITNFKVLKQLPDYFNLTHNPVCTPCL
jgi:hypothetical protein